RPGREAQPDIPEGRRHDAAFCRGLGRAVAACGGGITRNVTPARPDPGILPIWWWILLTSPSAMPTTRAHVPVIGSSMFSGVKMGELHWSKPTVRRSHAV